jgi:hypothetical protein
MKIKRQTPQRLRQKCLRGNPDGDITAIVEGRPNYITTHQISEGSYPALALLIRDIAKQLQSYGSLAKIPAEAVGNTRNDMYLTSEAIRFLQKDKESDRSKAEIATLGAYKKGLDGATKFIPDWVKFSVALALGLGTMIGWKRSRPRGARGYSTRVAAEFNLVEQTLVASASLLRNRRAWLRRHSVALRQRVSPARQHRERNRANKSALTRVRGPESSCSGLVTRYGLCQC